MREINDSHVNNSGIMQLIGQSFQPGELKDMISAMKDSPEKEIILSEYYLFTGKADEAAVLAKQYLEDDDLSLCLSAHIVYCISSITLGHLDEVQKTLENLDIIAPVNDEGVTGSYCADIVRILLHLPEKNKEHMNVVPRVLPEGVRLFACYVLALREYLRGEYGKAEGIAAAAIMLSAGRYPISEIYLHIISTISLMRTEQLDEAINHFVSAWELAMPDELLSPFGEHYVLLSGLNRKLIKTELNNKYQEIGEYADRYFTSWITVHNSHTDQIVAPGLTKMESTVATLFSRRWSVEKISQHLGISKNTVKSHLSTTYQKLNINKREQLRDYMLR